MHRSVIVLVIAASACEAHHDVDLELPKAGRALSKEERRETQRIDKQSATSDESGRFEIRSLRPDMRHTLMVHAGGFATLPSCERTWSRLLR